MRFRTWLWLMLAVPAVAGESPLFDLLGRLDPPARAHVSIWGAVTPFAASGQADLQGKFRFRKLRPGTYTVSVFVPGRGEARRTVDVGPGSADASRRVSLLLQLKDSDFQYRDAAVKLNVAPVSQLAVPEAARREMREARKELSRHRTEEAVRRLERAVKIAPGFAEAWNELGTIAYRSRQFPRAEECFRKSLAADPSAYEPLVNLGGVLVTLLRPDEALDYNLKAVLQRPGDALANSQMGMNYFQLRQHELALKYLEIARKIDPGHFSHPQLLLAELLMRENRRKEAAGALAEFLEQHPDYPNAEKMRTAIRTLLEAASRPSTDSR